ncbi:MAG: type 4a pilus biogenesis protein PilO [candidate division Zixibacteria bacterium]|nr:type 4a pilus biogenesis protein PilO [candidate division Zixibacteria bacterium]
MDLRDTKTQRIVIAALAFFIVAYFWYSRVYTPYDNEISRKSQEFETITTNLRNVEMKAKSLDALRLEYADLISRYHEIEALLPEVKQVPSILVQLHTASSLTGTRITKVEPQPIGSHGFYNTASFKIEMEGTYHDYGKFVSYVANFPFIANISNVELDADKVAVEKDKSRLQGSKNEQLVEHKKETITARFLLSTYYVKEEERLKELVL